MKTISVLLMAVMLAACTPKDYGDCLSSHLQHYSVPQFMTMCTGVSPNQICTQYWMGNDEYDREECDQWQYPNGDGPKSKK